MLRRVTALAREELAASGLFEMGDGGASPDERARTHWLRKCSGYEAGVAREIGAGSSSRTSPAGVAKFPNDDKRGAA